MKSAFILQCVMGCSLLLAVPAHATTFKDRLASLNREAFSGETLALRCTARAPVMGLSKAKMIQNPRVRLQLRQTPQGKLEASCTVTGLPSMRKQTFGHKPPGPYYVPKTVDLTFNEVKINEEDGTFFASLATHKRLPRKARPRYLADSVKKLIHAASLRGTLTVSPQGLQATIDGLSYQDFDYATTLKWRRAITGPERRVSTTSDGPASFSMR